MNGHCSIILLDSYVHGFINVIIIFENIALYAS